MMNGILAPRARTSGARKSTGARQGAAAREGQRRRLLATVHIAKKELGLDDELYREILRREFRVASAGDLDNYGLLRLVKSFERFGFAVRSKGHPGRPTNMGTGRTRAKMLKKVEALLTIGKRPWSYADALARRICGVDKVQWLDNDGLYKIIAALVKQGRREGWDLR